jgi:predicted RNase H-like nuclease (RuvC/YqgF family)
VYIVSSKFPRGNHVGEVNVKVTVLTTSSQVTLFDQKLITDTYMQSGSTFNQTISVILPSDARWYLTVQMDTVSYQQDLTNRQEAHVTLDATKIVTSTYSELQDNILEYQALYNKLDQKYKELSQQLEDLQTPVTGDCTQLQSDYLQLMQDYTSLTTQYNELLLSNQTGDNGNLENALQEMEQMYTELHEEFEATITSLEEEIHHQEEYIEELQGETQALSEENQNLEDEIEALEGELESKLGNEEELEVIRGRLSSAVTARNILGLLTTLSLGATAFVYYKYRIIG